MKIDLQQDEIINLKNGKNKKKQKRPKKKRVILKTISFFVVFIVTSSIFFVTQISVSKQSTDSWLDKIPIIKQIRHLAVSADKKLKGEERDRINILLLGMGGLGHDGAYLTDTIMLASLEPSTSNVSLVSIPRDMAVPIEDIGWRKINYVNASAEVKNSGSGGIAISQTLSDILNLPIDYYVRVDFKGFVNIVDELGGLDINVENTLDDYSYPVSGMEKAEPYEDRYEHLHIEKGWQTMDGELALKYARSRLAVGAEGSDFARARRQQKIIEAAKDKILSMHILFKPQMIVNITNELQEHISTNLQVWEMIKLWDIFRDINSDNITNRVLDDSPNGLLVATISDDGAYLLVPRSGDFAEIQYFINNVFSVAPQELKNVVTEERATIEVRNGTWINGLASQAALDLEKFGFTIVRIGNCKKQNFEKSMIYDLTFGEKTRSLSVLKNRTDADVSFSLPEWLTEEIKNDLTHEQNPIKPDFILVLGHDADPTDSGEENPENENN